MHPPETHLTALKPNHESRRGADKKATAGVVGVVPNTPSGVVSGRDVGRDWKE